MEYKVNMKEKTIDFTIRELCYYLFFGILFFAKGIGLYDGQMLFKILLVIGGGFWAMKMILTDYTKKEYFILIVLAAVAVISYYNSKEKGILLCAMTVMGMKYVPLKRIFKVALVVWTISFIPSIIWTTLGIVESPFRVHIRPIVGFVMRWGLGMAHPNVGHISYLVFVILVVYVLGEKNNWKWIFSLFLGNLFVFLYTVSNTGLLMTSFYLCAVIYLKIRKRPSCIEYSIVQCVFPSCILISLVLPLILKGKAFEILNKLMNTRIMQSKNYLLNEKITLFGTKPGLNNMVNTMDNSFLFGFVTYGIVVFLILISAYFIVIKKYVKEEKKAELAIIVTLFIAGISEPFLFNTSFKNISLLFLGEILFAAHLHTNSIEQKGNLWNLGQKKIFLKAVDFAKIIPVMEKNKKIILLISMISGILCAGVYGAMANIPEEIIVPRQLCDSVDFESIYLEEEIQNKERVTYGYEDQKTEMVSFGGNVVLAEYVRGILCRAVYGFALGFVVVLSVCCMIKYNNYKMIRSSSNEKRRKT